MVARASVFDNQEKRAIVVRAIVGALGGGANVFAYVPDSHGITESALSEFGNDIYREQQQWTRLRLRVPFANRRGRVGITHNDRVHRRAEIALNELGGVTVEEGALPKPRDTAVRVRRRPELGQRGRQRPCDRRLLDTRVTRVRSAGRHEDPVPRGLVDAVHGRRHAPQLGRIEQSVQQREGRDAREAA